MCWLAGVSRAGYYRSLLEQHPEEEDMRVVRLMREDNFLAIRSRRLVITTGLAA